MDDRRKKVVIGLAVAAADDLMNFFLQDSDCDSDEEAMMSTVLIQSQSRLRLKGSPQKPFRNENYLNVTVPRYTDLQFRQHFRVTRTTFENLEHRLGPVLSNHENTKGRPRIAVRKQLLSVLWLLATPDSFRSVADRFDMGKSILHDCFQRTIKALADEAPHFIVWPSGDKLQRVKEGFSRIGVLPNVIGAVDGSFIQIPKPMYYNTRKKFYAVVLQGVCNADLLFSDCHAGFPGSVPDIWVFRNADLFHAVNQNYNFYFPGDEYIIGDKAYPVLSWCIPPYINRGVLTAEQRTFNTALSSMRQVIERAFALLKGRFRRLKYLDMCRIDLVPKTILACCVLHNICILGKDEDNDDFIREGQAENGNEHEIDADNGPLQDILQDHAGEVKRTHLLSIVLQRLAQEN